MEHQTKNKKSNIVKFYSVFDKIWDILISFAIILVIIIVIIQILARFFDIAVPWTEESSRYAFIWMMFIGTALSMRKSEAARVTFFINMFPKAGKIITKTLYIVISAGFFIFMVISGAELVKQQIVMNEVGTAILMPMWLIGICLPVSGILGIISLVGNVLLDPELIDGGEVL